MTAPSDEWFDVFPAPRVADVLKYVAQTWSELRVQFADAVVFDKDEPFLTDNLCEALADRNRLAANRMGCDFQPETWELRRQADGSTVRLARADIRVILGMPGTPHLVMEFKKLDGTSGARWRYCFDGMNRFVDGKYAVDHPVGVMCGFSPHSLLTEATQLADYVRNSASAPTLALVPGTNGDVVLSPSAIDPSTGYFDTTHARPLLGSATPITLLHMLIPCPLGSGGAAPAKRKKPAKAKKKT